MPEKKTEGLPQTEKILLWFALLLCALVVGYNLFFTKDLSATGILLTTQSSNPVSEPVSEPIPAGVEGVIQSAPTSAPAGTLNLNEATASELAALLPGVGEVLAARIIEYREGKGGFTHVEELLAVDGIGEATFEAIRAYVTVS